MNKIATDPVVPFVEISSATKDALVVNWIAHRNPQRTVTGYRIGYQAVGSSVVQFVNSLSPVPTLYEITNLHENTVYNVCVEALTANVSSVAEDEGPRRPSPLRWGTVCATGATNAESVSVVLGSGVGAFLAIAVVVFFVVLAKWQHSHRKRKQRFVAASGEYRLDDRRRPDPVDGADDDDDLSAIFDRTRGSSSADGARLTSTPSLVFDLVEPSSMFVAELDDGQRYGLLLPLARASELLPLVVDDSVGSSAFDLAPGAGAYQVSDRRRRLQKYKTIDYEDDNYESAEKQLNGDILYAEHPDSYFSHIQFEPERLITNEYANENIEYTWLYRTRSLSV